MTYVCYIDTIIISLGNDGYNKNVDIKYMFPGSIFKHVKKNPRRKILDTYPSSETFFSAPLVASIVLYMLQIWW
jgi:hypothetical protein